MALAVSENHSTMVGVFSVCTRLRTSSTATAEMAAAASAAITPTSCWLPIGAPEPNRVSLGQETITTPTSPTTTALQR